KQLISIRKKRYRVQKAAQFNEWALKLGHNSRLYPGRPDPSFDNLGLLWRHFVVDADSTSRIDQLDTKLAFIWWRLWKNRNDVLYNGL
ncbi:hypothetical protein LINGRAHAP2_LOCUS14931, partial [Linum grandiflorum]